MNRRRHAGNSAAPIRTAGRRRIEVFQLSRAVPAVRVVILLFGIFRREFVDHFSRSGSVIEAEILSTGSQAEIGVKLRAWKAAPPIFAGGKNNLVSMGEQDERGK